MAIHTNGYNGGISPWSLYNQGGTTNVDLNQFLNQQRSTFGAGHVFGGDSYGQSNGLPGNVDPTILIQMMLIGFLQNLHQQLQGAGLGNTPLGQMLGSLGGNNFGGRIRRTGGTPLPTALDSIPAGWAVPKGARRSIDSSKRSPAKRATGIRTPSTPTQALWELGR